MKHIKTFENMKDEFGSPKSSVIRQLASGEIFTTDHGGDLAPLYLMVEPDWKGKFTAVPSERSPRELSGMRFTYDQTDSKPFIYSLQRIY